MSEQTKENQRFNRLIADLQFLNRLAYVYGARGVLNQVTGYTEQLWDARILKDDSLLASAAKCASRAVPNFAAVMMYYVARDARDGVLRTDPHALKKVHRETLLALSRML